ncbi:MAG: alkaline phosphatase family protein [Pseudomonadota bacterium]
MRLPLCALILIVTMGIASCSDSSGPVESRTIIIGFDGMDPRLAERWMAAGELPNFSRLAESGHYQRLGTTNPPQSPVAWSSFATGTNPGEHGIYDFLRRDAGDYSADFSIAHVREPDNHIELTDYRIPLSAPTIENRRRGEPFWTTFENKGARASVLRVPVTFPPDDVHRMLSGMGVPDMLGTQGTYTYYSTSHYQSTGGVGRLETVRAVNGVIETEFVGPPHPFRVDAADLSVPLSIRRAASGQVQVDLNGESFLLRQSQWSGWLPVEFKFAGVMGVRGMVRMYLVESFPHLKLYISPINLDPAAPAMPLSSPAGYSAELADEIGPYHTLGMPEETSSLNEGKISDDAYLDMIEHLLAERRAMLFKTLQRADSELVIAVFVQTDRVSHMFWRGLDEKHALHSEMNERGRNAINWVYREADDILGETMQEMGENDRLIVLSDHGFSDFRVAVNLNRWLIDQGYLVLDQGRSIAGEQFSGVDWSRTRAYAMGFNGIFINRAGREAQGVVPDVELEALKQEIMARMREARDPATGARIFTRGLDGSAAYKGNSINDAPDIVVGYAPPYRASWETVLGAAPESLRYENREKWSGDHCVDSSHVPGVLFTSFKPDRRIVDISQVSLLVPEQVRSY